MRIGIVPRLNGHGGGLYQYSLAVIDALDKHGNKGDHFVIFTPDNKHPAISRLEPARWTVKPLTRFNAAGTRQRVKTFSSGIMGESFQRKVFKLLRGQYRQLTKLSGSGLPDPEVIQSRPHVASWFRQCGVDLMLYPVPTALSFETGIPYIMAIHDLQHLIQPEFPEVSANGAWELREYLFRNGVRNAAILLADSEVGKEDILNFYSTYGVTSEQVKVLPFLPPPYLNNRSKIELQHVSARYKLPEAYLFYPAQFWPHKNHCRILQALALLRDLHDLKIPFVFCGASTGEAEESTFAEFLSLVKRLKLEDQVFYVGYVPDQEMAALYDGARGLVMPTFFGPTNIPVLEAWALRCPVLTSDIRGIREQAQSAAILVNPQSSQAIAEGMRQLWTNEELRTALIKRGCENIAAYTHIDFSLKLIEAIEEAKERVFVGKTER